MSNRLQVILNNSEYQLVKKTAKLDGKSISDWVRGLIRNQLIKYKIKKDKDCVEVMAQLNLPSPSIDQMLKEIDEGKNDLY